MSKALVRVELRTRNNRQQYDNEYESASYKRETEFKKMFAVFKKRCDDNDIARDYKQHSSYESEGRKKRRKKKESELQRLKVQLRENFGTQKRSK